MDRIDWTVQALADLNRLEDFLFSKNALASGRAIIAIVTEIDELVLFPNRGRPVPEGLRELPVSFSNSGYLVLYQVEGDSVRIARIRHQREAGY